MQPTSNFPFTFPYFFQNYWIKSKHAFALNSLEMRDKFERFCGDFVGFFYRLCFNFFCCCLLRSQSEAIKNNKCNSSFYAFMSHGCGLQQYQHHFTLDDWLGGDVIYCANVPKRTTQKMRKFRFLFSYGVAVI